jgi:hypothetical protein
MLQGTSTRPTRIADGDCSIANILNDLTSQWQRSRPAFLPRNFHEARIQPRSRIM